ncbi:MAG: DeoR/GlpR transcriptional regulator [Lachnospiraceae bacterium]|nr:DeoR/GlpR transcriptional regulator [Lachnospiraceae bacterium]
MKNNREEVLSRQHRILHLVKERGEIRVEDIVQMFGISAMTARRDLQILEDKKQLIRTHGGALSIDRAREEESLTPAMSVQLCRQQISAYAATLLQDGDVLFVNGSRTALDTLKYVREKRVRVCTNNGWALEGTWPAGVSFCIIGGEARGRIMVGEYVVRNLLNMRADKTLIGCAAVYDDGEFLYDIPTEIGINEAMISRTKGELYVLADHSKLCRWEERPSSYGSCSYNTECTLITDELADPQIVSSLKRAGIRVIMVPITDKPETMTE